MVIMLAGCIEPAELTKLRRMQEPRVLAGKASAEDFWRRADAIAQAYRAPASERKRLAEMIEVGRQADRGQISLEVYRVYHTRAFVRYEAQRENARRNGARILSCAISKVASCAPCRWQERDSNRSVQRKKEASACTES